MESTQLRSYEWEVRITTDLCVIGCADLIYRIKLPQRMIGGCFTACIVPARRALIGVSLGPRGPHVYHNAGKSRENSICVTIVIL